MARLVHFFPAVLLAALWLAGFVLAVSDQDAAATWLVNLALVVGVAGVAPVWLMSMKTWPGLFALATRLDRTEIDRVLANEKSPTFIR